MEKYNIALDRALASSASRHKHLCPRQVLGVRIGLAGGEVIGFDLPRHDKKLLVIAETDGCFIDGVEKATGCTVGHRTLRVEDYGKIAATFIDIKGNRAIRVAPRLDIRDKAWIYAPDEKRKYFAMLEGYKVMPTNELMTFQEVELIEPIESIISRAGVRANCHYCGEEIINEREVLLEGTLLCRACAGQTP